MKTCFVFKFINILRLFTGLFVRLCPLRLFQLVGVIEGDAHLRLIRRLQLPIGEGIHLLPHIRLDELQLVLLDELRERIDLFLIKQRHEVVAKATHLRVPIHELLLDVALLADLLHLTDAFEAQLLRGSLRVCALARHFLEHENDEGALVLVAALLRAAMKQDWHLIYFDHDIGEEKLVTVLWRCHDVIVLLVRVRLLLLIRLLSFATALVKIKLRTKSQVVALDLPNSLVEELMERRHR